MTTTTTQTGRLGHRQISVLIALLAGPVRSILALEPTSDYVHTWHYRAVHSLAKRGLVTLTPSGKGNAYGVAITAAGVAAVGYDDPAPAPVPAPAPAPPAEDHTSAAAPGPDSLRTPWVDDMDDDDPHHHPHHDDCCCADCSTMSATGETGEVVTRTREESIALAAEEAVEQVGETILVAVAAADKATGRPDRGVDIQAVIDGLIDAGVDEAAVDAAMLRLTDEGALEPVPDEWDNDHLRIAIPADAVTEDGCDPRVQTEAEQAAGDALVAAIARAAVLSERPDRAVSLAAVLAAHPELDGPDTPAAALVAGQVDSGLLSRAGDDPDLISVAPPLVCLHRSAGLVDDLLAAVADAARELAPVDRAVDLQSVIDTTPALAAAVEIDEDAVLTAVDLCLAAGVLEYPDEAETDRVRIAIERPGTDPTDPTHPDPTHPDSYDARGHIEAILIETATESDDGRPAATLERIHAYLESVGVSGTAGLQALAEMLLEGAVTRTGPMGSGEAVIELRAGALSPFGPRPTHWVDIETGEAVRIPLDDPHRAHREIRGLMRAAGYDLAPAGRPAPRYRVDYSDGSSEVFRADETVGAAARSRSRAAA